LIFSITPVLNAQVDHSELSESINSRKKVKVYLNDYSKTKGYLLAVNDSSITLVKTSWRNIWKSPYEGMKDSVTILYSQIDVIKVLPSRKQGLFGTLIAVPSSTLIGVFSSNTLAALGTTFSQRLGYAVLGGVGISMVAYFAMNTMIRRFQTDIITIEGSKESYAKCKSELERWVVKRELLYYGLL
jgi:hypothetical protein